MEQDNKRDAHDSVCASSSSYKKATDTLLMPQEAQQVMVRDGGSLDNKMQLHSHNTKHAWHNGMSTAMLHRVV